MDGGERLPGAVDSPPARRGGNGDNDEEWDVDVVDVGPEPSDNVGDAANSRAPSFPFGPTRPVVVCEAADDSAPVQMIIVDEVVDDGAGKEKERERPPLPGTCDFELEPLGVPDANKTAPLLSPSFLSPHATPGGEGSDLVRSPSQLSILSLTPSSVKRSLNDAARNIKGLVQKDRWVDEAAHVDAPASHEDFNENAERLFMYEGDNVCYEWADGVGRWSRRRSFLYALWTAVWMMLLAMSQGAVFIGYMFAEYYTRLQCFFAAEKDWPSKAGWTDMGFACFETFFLHLCHYALLVLMYGIRRSRPVAKLNLGISISCTLYVILMQLVGLRTSWIGYVPKNIVLTLTFPLNSYLMTRAHMPLTEPRKERIRFGVVLSAPIALAVVSAIIFSKIAMPFYSNPDTSENSKLALTIFAPAFFAASQALCRMCAERCRLNHAGTSYVLMIIQQGLSAALLRIMQAGLQNVGDVVIIGIYFGALGIADRATIMLRDGIAYIIFRCGKRLPGDFFKIPRRRRLIADIIIVDLFFEYAGIVIGNGVVLGVRIAYLKEGSSAVGAFFERTAIQLAIQSISTAITIYLAGALQNLPVMRAWRRFWRSYATTIALVILMGAFYFMQPLTETIRTKISESDAHLPCVSW